MSPPTIMPPATAGYVAYLPQQLDEIIRANTFLSEQHNRLTRYVALWAAVLALCRKQTKIRR